MFEMSKETVFSTFVHGSKKISVFLIVFEIFKLSIGHIPPTYNIA